MSTRANLNNHPARPGFRLQRLEVRNWGTFHEKVHLLDPGGHTALLIGENGSGKSTLVDAFLTLLVPKAKRNYNLSAGSAKRKERDERTYVLGAYGSESGSEESRAQTKFLRKAGDPPSILLAYFVNEATDDAVTLAQLLWVQDDDVRKLFLVCRRERSIQKDFSGLGDSKGWKKMLRQRGFEVEDGFKEYAEKVVRYLRMESLTTLALFSQTVAIKEITHVSGFIRDHMLERLDTKELVDRLEHHYQDLTECWNAIERAKRQLELLKPVVEKAEELGQHDEKLREARRFMEALPACFAVRLKALLEAELKSLAAQIKSLENEIQSLTGALTELAGQEFSLKQAIESDEVGKELTRVQEQLDATAKAEQQRKALSVPYHVCLAELGVKGEVTTAERFKELFQWAGQEQETQGAVITETANEQATANQEFSRLRGLHDNLSKELVSLRARPDLIPEEHREMRRFIAQGADVSVADLPFAGELMDVREEQKTWRGALERLLRGFGLSMLVPEHLYSRVNRFINDTDLRGRVIYHRVPKALPAVAPSHDKGRVIEKMKLKEGHLLAGWVEAELRSRFNHRCCETIDEFESSTGFAVTKQGLIRAGGTRHIKDDTTAINDPRNHILGWSNRDKIRRLEQEQREFESAMQTQGAKVADAQKRQKTAETRATQAARLLSYHNFTDIDWRSAEQLRVGLEGRKLELEQSSDKIRKLQEQLENVQEEIRTKDGRKTEAAGERGGLGTKQDAFGSQLRECESTLATNNETDLACFDERFTALLAGTEFTIANASVAQHKAQTTVSTGIIEQEKSRSKIVEAITKHMEKFLGEFAELRTDLNSGEEFLPDFLRVHKSVHDDDLPRHGKRFQELMSHDVLAHVVLFQDTLDDHCSEIQSKVDHLNAALKTIEYSPKTCIAIRANPTLDLDIRDFRGRLKGCLEYGLNPDEAARENAFRRISDLIKRFREKPDWAAKVTDTRNWLNFAVEELNRETGGQENFYTDTGGKSGGQKAKLAFTILASAIAYQYGIAKDPQNPVSFRFVVVDEMFSRCDETNSRYALQLFAKFHLQLLIVCPFDARARVVEPFVSSYHLTLNPTTQSSSVRTVTVEEVHECLAKQSAPPRIHAVS